MASVALKSQIVTDLDATPVVKTNQQEVGGVIRETIGIITTNSDDSIGSTYRFCRIPSRARITEVIGIADVGSAGAGIGDVGLYQTAANGGAVVDADHFASAWDFSNADEKGILLTHEAAAAGCFLAVNAGKQVWEAAGLTSDPGRDYDVTMTLTEAVTTGAAVIAIKVRYVLPE